MQLRLLRTVDDIRSSYWFVPSVMAVGALLLGAGAIYLDARIGSEWLEGISWYQRNTPDGAQEVLSTIAGSAITVAGVVFSITIVAVSFAASQYGPRILTNFMADRGNQITLGTFIATYLYCLVVLRTIRGGDEGNFVPDLAVLIALLLALASIGVLIFFIHHVPRSIHVNSVVAGVGRQLIAALNDRFPEFIGNSKEKDASASALPPPFCRDNPSAASGTVAVCSRSSGYIEAIDDERLMSIACDRKLVLRIHHAPGDFIREGQCFAEAWPPENVPPEALHELQRTLALSTRRTPLQDTKFLIDELVEIGTRALSPGVNDPFTAITCLDWLGAALSEVAPRKLPDEQRVDNEGTVRVIASPLTFDELVERALGQFRQYLASDKNACMHALHTIVQVADSCSSQKQLKSLARQAEELRSTAEGALHVSLFEPVQIRTAQVLKRISETRR